jgi:hypothetical protein
MVLVQAEWHVRIDVDEVANTQFSPYATCTICIVHLEFSSNYVLNQSECYSGDHHPLKLNEVLPEIPWKVILVGHHEKPSEIPMMHRRVVRR